MTNELIQRATATAYLIVLIFTGVAVPLLIITLPHTLTPSPLGPLLSVAALLAIGWAVGKTSVAGLLQRWLLGLATRSGLISGAADHTEVTRVNLIRIVVGFIMFCRAAEVMRGVLWTENLYSMQGVGAAFMLLCGFALTVGMATPLFAFLSTLLMPLYVDAATGTLTLGTFVFMMPAMVFTFLPAGTALSLDAWLARRSHGWERILVVLYMPFGRPCAERSAILRFLALVSYALVCLYSASFHYWHDTAWQGGYAILIALTNSFFSRHFDVFVSLYNNYPGLAILLSRTFTHGMIAWEGLLLPLVLISRPTRIFAIWWGLTFFAASRLLFSLSYLPYYEIALWALLFLIDWKMNVNGRETIEVYFDDRCNLCDRTMRVLTALDLFDVVAPRPLSKFHTALAAQGIDYETALTDLYGYDPADGRLKGGYDFYIFATSRMLLLQPLYPVLWLGKTTRIGPMIYRFVAERRTRVFGVCQLSTVRTKATLASPLAVVGTRAMSFVLPGAYTVAVLLFFLGWLTPLDAYRATPLFSAIQWAPLSFGIIRIDVFNQPDLTTSNNFVVVYRVNKDGTEDLVPYTGLYGERLGMDGSDRILYGVSLPWRHQMSSVEGACYSVDHLALIDDVMTYDRMSNGKVPMAYRFDYYYQPPLTKASVDAHAKISSAIASCSVVFDPMTNQPRADPKLAVRR